jgi:hypothetical protein
MCNYSMANSKIIPESGYGWKIFRKKDKDLLFPCFWDHPYTKGEDNWITWTNNLSGQKEIGFCFFPTREEARKCLYELKNMSSSPFYYSNNVIRRIEYKQGIEEHITNKIVNDTPFRSCLAKKFRIIGIKNGHKR